MNERPLCYLLSSCLEQKVAAGQGTAVLYGGHMRPGPPAEQIPNPEPRYCEAPCPQTCAPGCYDWCCYPAVLPPTMPPKGPMDPSCMFKKSGCVSKKHVVANVSLADFRASLPAIKKFYSAELNKPLNSTSTN